MFVSIPYSSGLSFRGMVKMIRAIMAEIEVSIPYSSGLSFRELKHEQLLALVKEVSQSLIHQVSVSEKVKH